MSTYPPADAKTQWFDDDFGWDVIVPNVLVWHTTETMNWPGYDGGAKAPHITVRPDIPNKRLQFRQHFASEHSSRALQNLPGGVATNTNNAFQVELVGTCDDAYAKAWGTRKAGIDYIHWPTAPEWALAALADLVKYLDTRFDVPLRSTVTWANYKSPTGLLADVRLSGAQFQTYTGHLGHQHVPENNHGDPGKFPIQKVLDYATAAPTPPALTTTECVVTTYPTVVASGMELTLTATVKPAVPGRVQFQWYTAGGFRNFGPQVAVSNGRASIVNKPSASVIYRAIFYPTDTAKYKGDYSPNLPVEVVDLGALVDRVEKLEKQSG
jgi:hypothetical protein